MPVSNGDIIAISFGIAATVIGITTAILTRKMHRTKVPVDVEMQPSSTAPEVIINNIHSIPMNTYHPSWRQRMSTSPQIQSDEPTLQHAKAETRKCSHHNSNARDVADPFSKINTDIRDTGIGKVHQKLVTG